MNEIKMEMHMSVETRKNSEVLKEQTIKVTVPSSKTEECVASIKTTRLVLRWQRRWVVSRGKAERHSNTKGCSISLLFWLSTQEISLCTQPVCSKQMKKKKMGSNLTKGSETLEWEILWGKRRLSNTWLLLKDMKNLWILLVISDQEKAQRQDKSWQALPHQTTWARISWGSWACGCEDMAESNRMQEQREWVNINLLWDFVNKYYLPLNFVMNSATLRRCLQETFSSGRGAWNAQRTLLVISLSWTKISVSLTSDEALSRC